jgi:hypothetical protein
MTESTTSALATDNDLAAMLASEAASWQELAGRLPQDLAASAQASGALLRRREIRSASDLLRMAFAYAVCDWPLRLVGAWLATLGLAQMSDVAILKRLKQCQYWLGLLVVQCLQQRSAWLAESQRVRLRIVDATQVADAGQHNWYVHACFDLGAGCLAGVEVTDAHSGESLVRFPGQPDEIYLADRGYAHAKGLGGHLASGTLLVVRCHWQNLALQQEDGSALDVLRWLRSSEASSFSQPIERTVWLATPAGRFRLRLIAAALPPEALERARQRVREKARKMGRTPGQDNLFACGFILVLTNLPADSWSAPQVLALYRLRWQVELLFKRYKSIFQLTNLRARDPQLVQTYLLAKLLAALLADQMLLTTQELVPEWFSSLERPVSLWRLSHWVWAQLSRWVQGPITWTHILAVGPRLRRYLCDSPRRRPQQLASARTFLSRLSAC